MKAHALGVALFLFGLSLGVHTQTDEAQQGPEVIYTAVSANVAAPGEPVRIRIFRWSTERERRPVLAALDPLPPPVAAGGGERAGGAARGGRGGAARGRGGRGGAAAAPLTPAAALAGAIRRAPSVGYLWTNDVTGYSIKYAFRAPLPDGGERIVLATDRRLGTHTAGWQPVTASAPTDYPFTVLEIRLDPKGVGEARTSLTTEVVVDKEADTLSLQNYGSALVLLQKVRAAATGG